MLGEVATIALRNFLWSQRNQHPLLGLSMKNNNKKLYYLPVNVADSKKIKKIRNICISSYLNPKQKKERLSERERERERE